MLRELREKYGYTQEYVARRLSMSQTAYGNREREITDYVESEDSFSVLKDIVELLNYLKKFQFSK